MSNNNLLTYKVTTKDTLNRADIFIKGKFENFTRSQIKKLIESNNIKINDNIIKPSTKIESKDKITITLPELESTELKPLNQSLDIKYENKDLIIINKPSGIVVHPSKGHQNDTIINALIGMGIKFESYLGKPKPWLVHRLDKDTSGLLIIAKNEITYNYLTKIQKTRMIKKQYIGIVQGIPNSAKAIIDAPIGRNKLNRKTMSITKEGRHSLTEYAITKSNNNMSLLKITLLTGRTHQIRVHLKAIGHPIIGDILYGKKSKYVNRQMLHAYKLSFKDELCSAI
ncbi:MAG TPA: RluA family pseudouridine synthase [Dehalococcoidia bacterium]|nr:RluA family pseudouridine synthase [Dehalococcoidia bacterium]